MRREIACDFDLTSAIGRSLPCDSPTTGITCSKELAQDPILVTLPVLAR